MGMFVESMQPCWTCKKAYGGCSWTEVMPDGSIKFEPVAGWIAEKSTRSVCGRSVMESYKIEYCPEYEQEEPRGEWSPCDATRVLGLTKAHLTIRQIALLLDTSMSEVRRCQEVLRKSGLL